MDNNFKDSERKNLNDHSNNVNREDTLTEFENQRETYQKEFGGLEPSFKGPQIGYYGNSILCYIVIILALIPAYIYTAGALVGEIYAAIYYGKEYSIACGVLLWV